MAFLFLLLVGAHARLLAQSGISTEGPFTVFRTGTNEPLLTLSLPFSAPPTNSPSLLRFDFGFATEEPDLPDTFFDSFSVTLQRNDQSATALLLTADRTGVQWAPTNPGGLTLNPTDDVQHADTPFPNLTPSLALKFAYSITFALPMALAGGPLTLFLDLFDNLNAASSLAYVQGMRLESVVSGVKLHSADNVSGPYSEEPGAAHDEAARTFTLSKPAGNRFFRVFTDKPTRILSIRSVGPQLVIRYQFEVPGQLALLTSSAVTGPFAADTNAVLDLINQTFTLPKPPTNWFFRIVGDRSTRIIGIRAVGSQVVVEYRLVLTTLESAATVTGPYTEETSAVLNQADRTFTMNKPTGSRFYRLSSDVSSRLKPPRASGNQLVLEYEFNP